MKPHHSEKCNTAIFTYDNKGYFTYLDPQTRGFFTYSLKNEAQNIWVKYLEVKKFKEAYEVCRGVEAKSKSAKDRHNTQLVGSILADKFLLEKHFELAVDVWIQIKYPLERVYTILSEASETDPSAKESL
jgi:hypothetical protein